MDKKSYTIRLCLQKNDLIVLKKALEIYPDKKDITSDLLGIIKYQVGQQNEQSNKKP